MADPTPESVIEREFQEVEKTRESLLAKRAEIDEQLQQVEQRFTNLRNALAALEGKFTPPTRAPSVKRRPRASSGDRAPRGSREQLKTRISDLLKQHPKGLVANQITTAIPGKGVPNLLSLMKKEGMISQEARRGPYCIV
jgi:hypothetical protein